MLLLLQDERDASAVWKGRATLEGQDTIIAGDVNKAREAGEATLAERKLEDFRRMADTILRVDQCRHRWPGSF